jgi:hypothetical protein
MKPAALPSPFHVIPLEATSVFAPCDVCHRIVQMGPIFEGRYVAAQEAIVCNLCWELDRDGWRRQHEVNLASPPS